MIPNDKTLRGQTIQQMLDFLKQNPSNLTSWEFEFVYDVAEKHKRGLILSSRTCDILEEIYNKNNG